MNPSPENKRYNKQWGIAGVLYECEPIGFKDIINSQEMEALRTYYFLGRKVDIDNIYEYRNQLTKTNPQIVKLAEATLLKIAKLYKVDENEIRMMFS